MNLLSPTPFLGFNSIYRGPVTYGAFSSELYLGGGIVTNRLQYIVSPDGLTWHHKTISGDIAGFTSSAGAGSYHAVDHIIFDGAIYSYGRIWTGESTSMLGLFKSADGGQSFDRITTAVDGSTGSRGYVDAVVFGSTLVLLSSTGDLVYTSNGIQLLDAQQSRLHRTGDFCRRGHKCADRSRRQWSGFHHGNARRDGRRA
jgi:hypothetical protein